MVERSAPRSSYRIVDYDPGWPLQFQHEKSNIVAVLGNDTSSVEHIGSTAVPRLGAKPIIDLMVGIPLAPTLDGIQLYVEPLGSIGYENRGIETVPGTFYLRKADPRRYNLHLTEYGGNFWAELLLFRDFLQSHDNIAQQYEDLKHQLIARLGPDPERAAYAAYNDGKATFITSVVEQARAEIR